MVKLRGSLGMQRSSGAALACRCATVHALCAWSMRFTYKVCAVLTKHGLRPLRLSLRDQEFKGMCCAHWHPCLISSGILAVRPTFSLQPEKVGKKGRSPARLLLRLLVKLCRPLLAVPDLRDPHEYQTSLIFIA